MEQKTKRCSKCRKIFPLTNEYFYKNSSRADGYGHYCKKCILLCQQSPKGKQTAKKYRESEKGQKNN